MDVYDHIQETEVKQAFAIVASLAHHAVPKPKPARKSTGTPKP